MMPPRTHVFFHRAYFVAIFLKGFNGLLEFLAGLIFAIAGSERLYAWVIRLTAPELYRDRDGTIVMCSNCRKTRRVGVAPETWDWVAALVANQPAGVSHGLCKICLEYYYPFPVDI